MNCGANFIDTGILSSPPTITANSNRHGEAFDVGETFSGMDYELGLHAVEEIRRIVPSGITMRCAGFSCATRLRAHSSRQGT